MGCCSIVRSPSSCGAKNSDGGSGSPGCQTYGKGIRLRECLVVLTRPHRGWVGDGTLDRTDAEHLGRTSLVRETSGTVQAVASLMGNPARVTQEGGTGVIILLPLQDFTCVLCGVSASALAWVRRHFLIQYGIVLVRYSCRSCGKIMWKKRPRLQRTEHKSIHELHVHPDIRNSKRIARKLCPASGTLKTDSDGPGEQQGILG